MGPEIQAKVRLNQRVLLYALLQALLVIIRLKPPWTLKCLSIVLVVVCKAPVMMLKT